MNRFYLVISFWGPSLSALHQPVSKTISFKYFQEFSPKSTTRLSLSPVHVPSKNESKVSGQLKTFKSWLHRLAVRDGPESDDRFSACLLDLLVKAIMGSNWFKNYAILCWVEIFISDFSSVKACSSGTEEELFSLLFSIRILREMWLNVSMMRIWF